MKLTYKAQKSSGEFYEAEQEASDKFALARELKAAGETLISAEEKSERVPFDWNKLLSFGGGVKMHDKIIFARNLGGMLAAGLPVSRALGVLERQTESHALKQVVVSLAERIGKGVALHQALAEFPRVFPPVVIGMVRAGEEGGKLASSLKAVAEQLDRAYALRRKVRGALMYPAVVVTVMIAVGILMLVYIVPRLTSAFSEVSIALPFSTRVIIAVSEFLRDHFLVGAGLTLFIVVALVAMYRSARGKRLFDFTALRAPLLAPLVRELNAARAARTLSALLSSGVEVISALDITASVVQNYYYRDVLLLAKAAIAKGEPISSVFRAHEDIYPPLISEMIAVGEETGRLSEMLEETGVFFENEVDQKTKDLSTVIEPLLMVVVGVAVGFFAIAMISPAYTLMNSI